jgi:NADH dehydrogenase
MILVSGGTGLVGSAVVTELLRRGEQVAVLGRDAEKIRRRYGDKVEARAADVSEPGSLPAAMTGVDVLVNAVQLPNSPIENKRRGWTFEQVDYQGTVNQVDAAKQAGVKRFVYVSGAGAAPAATKHWYRFKWQAEQYLANSGLEWVIVRQTWVYGPHDSSLNRLLKFGRFLPFIPIFGDGQQAMQPVFIDDVGRVQADAATRLEAANQLFELGGPDVMTMNDVLKTALDVMGKKRPILHQPVVIGKALGTLMSLLPSPPLPPMPLSADAVDFITEPAVGDTSRLLQILQPRLTPFREGLETYLAPH